MDIPSVAQILPNLGVGALSILSLAWVTQNFLKHIQRKDKELLVSTEAHQKELREREIAFRELEKEIRTNMVNQLSSNTNVMTRVLDYLNNTNVK